MSLVQFGKLVIFFFETGSDSTNTWMPLGQRYSGTE